MFFFFVQYIAGLWWWLKRFHYHCHEESVTTSALEKDTDSSFKLNLAWSQQTPSAAIWLAVVFLANLILPWSLRQGSLDYHSALEKCFGKVWISIKGNFWADAEAGFTNLSIVSVTYCLTTVTLTRKFWDDILFLETVEKFWCLLDSRLQNFVAGIIYSRRCMKGNSFQHLLGIFLITCTWIAHQTRVLAVTTVAEHSKPSVLTFCQWILFSSTL